MADKQIVRRGPRDARTIQTHRNYTAHSTLRDDELRMIDDMVKEERKANIDEALAIARTWMPKVTNYTYEIEIKNRVRYFLGSMQADMTDELKRRFPDTWEKIYKEQLNVRLVRRLILNRAKIFNRRTGEIYLIDEKDERIDPKSPDAKAFADLVDRSQLWTTLQSADAYTQLCHRAGVKVWFDKPGRRLRYSVYAPNLVYIVPDPLQEWSADAAYAQIFVRAGLDGVYSTPRYEVWGIRHPDAIAAEYPATLHFMTDSSRDWQLNDMDKNPFVDPRTKKPMYPMVWWQDDDEASLYVLGDEDLLTANRAINSGLTDLRNNVHFQAFGVPTYTQPEGAGVDMPAKRIMSPSDVVDLPPGVELDFVSPNLPIEEVASFWQLMMKLEALMDGQSPSAIRVEGREAMSGYALTIENQPLTEHREAMAPIMVPYAEDSAYRGMIVYNTYAKEVGLHPIKAGLRPKIDPGVLDIPPDPEAIGRIFAAKIAADVATAIDWRMVEYGEDRKTAEAAVKENAEFNAEHAQMAMVGVTPALMQEPEGSKPAGEPAEPVEVDEPDQVDGKTGGKEKSEGEGVESADPDKIVANVYQIVKAIEVNAATAVDLRMALYPDENRQQATVQVKENAEFNKDMAILRAEIAAAEAKAMGKAAPPDLKNLPIKKPQKGSEGNDA